MLLKVDADGPKWTDHICVTQGCRNARESGGIRAASGCARRECASSLPDVRILHALKRPKVLVEHHVGVELDPERQVLVGLVPALLRAE